MKHILTLTTILMLAACAAIPAATPQSYLTKKGLTEPTTQTIQHCRGYGCQYIDTVTLSKNEWKQIAKHFKPKAKTPEQERKQIATAIGTFETIIGAKTGSEEDIHGTFIKTGTYQLDCVDESTNTTLYMLALKNHGLIKLHNIHSPEGRFPLIHSGRWPHQAALIKEKASENYYIVDSWFHDNGAPAEIVPLKQWKDGWKPENKE